MVELVNISAVDVPTLGALIVFGYRENGKLNLVAFRDGEEIELSESEREQLWKMIFGEDMPDEDPSVPEK